MMGQGKVSQHDMMSKRMEMMMQGRMGMPLGEPRNQPDHIHGGIAMWGYDHGGGLMGIGMILLWLIPIALLVWLFAKAAAGRTSKDETHRPPPPKSLPAGEYDANP